MALSDLIKPRICELGKIKIGGLGQARQSQKGGTYRMPRKDDHFTVTTLVRTQEGDLLPDETLMQDLLRDYGDKDGKLRRLPIALLSDEIEDVMQSQWVWYAGKKIGARSADAKTVEWFVNKDGKPLDKPLTTPWKAEYETGKQFKLHTTFNCVIASKYSRWGGVYKLRTTSQISAAQLYGSLLHIKEGITRGPLRGIPMRLVVRPMQVAPEGKPTTVYVVHVEVEGEDLVAIQNKAVELAKIESRNHQQLIEYRRMLADPGFESDATEIGDLAAEFHPPEEPAAAPPATMGRLDLSGAPPEQQPETNHETPALAAEGEITDAEFEEPVVQGDLGAPSEAEQADYANKLIEDLDRDGVDTVRAAAESEKAYLGPHYQRVVDAIAKRAKASNGRKTREPQNF